jgi:hypothetical protein
MPGPGNSQRQHDTAQPETPATRRPDEFREYYAGNISAGRPEGLGLIRWIDQTEYAGSWSNGQIEGCGVETYEDGSWYAGGFVGDVRHGCGGMWFANGVVFVGQWQVCLFMYVDMYVCLRERECVCVGVVLSGMFRHCGGIWCANGVVFVGQWQVCLFMCVYMYAFIRTMGTQMNGGMHAYIHTYVGTYIYTKRVLGRGCMYLTT